VTYGHGLIDCFIKDGNRPKPEPSKIAWPNQLGKLLNMEVVNKAKPGASNLEILFHILNFEFEATDTVVILWSYPSRDLIFKVPSLTNPFPYIPLGVWMESELAKSWMSTHSNHDMVTRSWLNIHHAEQYLNNNKITNRSFFVNSIDLQDYKPDYLTFDNVNLENFEPLLMHENDVAEDGSHPGPIAHVKLANRLYDIISPKIIVPK
jgi:hypothetical protein